MDEIEPTQFTIKALDAAIEEALRSAPLEAAPPECTRR